MRGPFPACRVVLGAVVISAGLVACTHEPPLPRAIDTVDTFINAFNRRDARAMVGTFGHDAGPWKARRLKRFMAHTLGDGDVTRFGMTRTGAVPQPPDDEVRGATTPIVAHAPYTITYRSAASRDPVTLEGELAVAFRGGRWNLQFKKGIFWPGVKRAAGFHVAYRWPPRGALLDRNGRRLAAGSGMSRHYPFGALAGTTVGHLAPLTAGEVADAAAGHSPGDLVGASGLERGLDAELAGSPASRLEVVAEHGKVLATLGRKKGSPGHDVKTTLDTGVQAAAEAGYGPATGGAVVIDPRTGDLLAVVSSSPFDPNNYVGVSGVQPFNRALSGLYPPGSSMKVVTASAALDSGTVSSSSRLSGPKEFRGVRNFESESFTSLSFAQALEFSVNTAFAQVALKLGAKKLHHYADLFGFNETPTLPVSTARSSFPLAADEADLMWGAVGQAQDLATPLEMATVAATVADRGTRMDPRITLKTHPHGRRVISKRSAATMTQLMELVVRGGTGTAAAIPGVTVAGKTGTAEVSLNGVIKDHAWFVCFAPAENPKVAVAVVVEYGGVGGEVAAPLAHSILQRVLPITP